MEAWLQSLLTALALPQFGLSTVFVVSMVSATLLPMGSEPAVFGLVKLNPDMFWPAIGVATKYVVGSETDFSMCSASSCSVKESVGFQSAATLRKLRSPLVLSTTAQPWSSTLPPSPRTMR